jgi:ABC-type amino acid transport substrate-binding protein
LLEVVAGQAADQVNIIINSKSPKQLSSFSKLIIYLFMSAFNWKEKQQLRLANKQQKKFKAKPFGDFDELMQFFDEKRGDVIIDPSVTGGYKSPDLQVQSAILNNPRKTISVPMLFGSAKPYGPLYRKHNRFQARFSHRRVFGDKHASIEGK